MSPEIVPLYSRNGPTQVANRLKMEAQNLEKKALRKYRSDNRRRCVYTAASRLRAHGVAWDESLKMINDAFDACIQTDD